MMVRLLFTMLYAQLKVLGSKPKTILFTIAYTDGQHVVNTVYAIKITQRSHMWDLCPAL